MLPTNLQNTDGLLKVTTFLMYAPQFKDDIVLILEPQWPVDVPPPILPLSITWTLRLERQYDCRPMEPIKGNCMEPEREGSEYRTADLAAAEGRRIQLQNVLGFS